MSAWVGTLDRRVHQHLVLRNSSVVTGVTVASLNPEHIRDVWWWESPEFPGQGET